MKGEANLGRDLKIRGNEMRCRERGVYETDSTLAQRFEMRGRERGVYETDSTLAQRFETRGRERGVYETDSTLAQRFDDTDTVIVFM